MGYYTEHKLSVTAGSEQLIEVFRDECEEASYALKSDGGSCNWAKWPRHEEDLRAFSKMHPGVIFTLSGKGEESSDIWIEYYGNGLIQKCKAIITFDEFDKDKLK